MASGSKYRINAARLELRKHLASTIDHTYTFKRGTGEAVAIAIEKAARAWIYKVKQQAKESLDENGSVRTGLLKKAVDAKVVTFHKMSKERMEHSKMIKRRGRGGGIFYLSLDTSLKAQIGINSNVSGAYVDVPGGKRHFAQPSKYAHLVEFGHEKGKNPRGGKVEEKPFMRTAIAKAGGVAEFERLLINAAKEGLENAK